jgi:K+/H+ antiporter YhaU regulatory subunit KhtT
MIHHALGYLNVPEENAASYLSEFRNAIELAHREPRGDEAELPEVREIAIAPGMEGHGTLGQQQVRERFGVTVLSIARTSQETLLNPTSNAHFETGDRVRVFGLREQIRSFEDFLKSVSQFG